VAQGVAQSVTGGLGARHAPAGQCSTGQNLLYNGDGRAVWFTAGVAIVYERRPAQRQRFFLGHDGDIRSLALCPTAVGHKGQQYQGGRVAATGQQVRGCWLGCRPGAGGSPACCSWLRRLPAW
jgi:hypothetical protein